MSALSRRQVFLTGAAVVGAAALPTALAAANPDAALIATCAEAEALGTAYHKAFDDHAFDEARQLSDPWADRVIELREAIVDPKATTLAGLVARAKALIAYGGSDFADPDDKFHGWEESVSASIVRDLLAMVFQQSGVPADFELYRQLNGEKRRLWRCRSWLYDRNRQGVRPGATTCRQPLFRDRR